MHLAGPLSGCLIRISCQIVSAFRSGVPVRCTFTLMVIVDGLNEVSADTREKIGAFARDMSKGDVMVATQPIEWHPPPNCRTVELLPLNRSEATAFIESRPVGADPNQPCHGLA